MPKPADKPTIAIDIDEVLAANAPDFVEFSNKQWGTNLAVEDYHEHWTDLWRVDEAEMEKRVHEYMASGQFGRFSPVVGANEVLRKLAKDYRLVIVTSRRKLVEKETRSWLDKNFSGIFDHIQFAGIWDEVSKNRIKMTKTEHLKQLQSDYFIDDQPSHCLAAAKAGIEVLLFGDYKWNRGLKLPKGVTWVKNWQEVLEYFEGRS